MTLSTQQPEAGNALPHIPTIPQEASNEASDSADSQDGQVLRDEIELDAHIKSLGELAEKAVRERDRPQARRWMVEMYAAIRSRSAAHQARLTAEIERRIADEGDFNGDWTMEVMKLGRRVG
jgi:hypothetical protein